MKRFQPQTARDYAVEAIAAVYSRRQFAADRLEALDARSQLDPREAGLATQLAYGTVRHTITISAVLKHVAEYEPARVKPLLRAILHCGAFQVIYLDRVPTYAAVDEAVEQAKRHAGKRGGAMVNAILRRLTKAIVAEPTEWKPSDPRLVRLDWSRARAFSQAVLPDPVQGTEARFLADASGAGARWCDRWTADHGSAEAASIAWAAQAEPPIVIQRNALGSDETWSTLSRSMSEASAGESAAPARDVLYSSRITDSLRAALHAGDVYVQDVTAHGVVDVLEPEADEQILDYCAAPGGKTIATAIRMRNRGRVVAADTSEDRLARLAQNATRLGLHCVTVHPWPADGAPGAADDVAIPDTFDAVLVDVPCSNTGVFARRPEARFNAIGRLLPALTELQLQLMQDAAKRVRVNGRLVYSTCSIEPSENEALLQRFLASNVGWRQTHQQLTLPQWGSACSAWRDGGYVARLERSE